MAIYIDLSNNYQTHLPDIQNYTNLKQLRIDQNGIEELLDVHHLVNLKKLDLQHNKISQIPDTSIIPTELEVLNLSDNSLEYLSTDIIDYLVSGGKLLLSSTNIPGNELDRIQARAKLAGISVTI